MITTPHYFKKQEEAENITDAQLKAMLINDIKALEPNINLDKVKIRIELKRGMVEFWAYVEENENNAVRP